MSIAYPESFIEDILREIKTIAVVGASSKKDRDSYKVMQSLIKNGYRVFPINPNESGKTSNWMKYLFCFSCFNLCHVYRSSFIYEKYSCFNY